MMRTYSWLGVGMLVLFLSGDAAKAQAPTTGVARPLSAMFQTTGVQQNPTLTANYFGLVQAQSNARQSQLFRAQLSQQAQIRTQAQRRSAAQANFTNLPWFATNWIQIRTVPVQRPRNGRR
jgi:hypothetical protein